MDVKLPPDLDEYLDRRREVLEEVRKLLIVTVDLQRDPDEIDPDTALFGTGLGLDSLDAAEIIIGLEVDLGIKLEGQENQVVALRSVNALVDLILRARGLER